MIHDQHPFLPPEPERDPIRRFRGRLTSPVTLWTAVHEDRRAGLPVSSLSVVEGPHGHIVGAIDPDSELWSLLSNTGRFAIAVLSWQHRGLAAAFAGADPAPGGPFRLSGWLETDWGPVPDTVVSWAGCTLVGTQPLGWSMLVTARLEHVELGEESDAPGQAALAHRRGRYFPVPPDR